MALVKCAYPVSANCVSSTLLLVYYIYDKNNLLKLTSSCWNLFLISQVFGITSEFSTAKSFPGSKNT